MDATEKTIGDLTVILKRDTCIGSGNCTKVGPDAFHLDDEALVAFNEEAGQADPQQATEAANVCPVQAIIAMDRDGHQVAP